MIDDERLKALKMVTEAKETVDDALPTTTSEADREELEEIEQCLEEAEGDLVITYLDQSLSELEELKQHLLDLTSRVNKDDPDLKDVVKKTAAAAKEITKVVEVARKVVKVPEKLIPEKLLPEDAV